MFDINDLLVENANTSNFIVESSFEESFFLSTLKFVTEMDNEYVNCRKVLYKSILESGDDRVLLNESFSDFTGKVKEIIDKFLKFIKSLFERFITALHKLIKSDKYLKKNKDKFTKFNSEDEFEYKGYIYSFNDAVPVINVLAEFKTDFVGLNPDDLTGDKANNKKVLNKAFADMKSNINENYYDKIRAEVLGKEGSIYKEDFHSELVEIFRSGQSEKENITVNSDLLSLQYTFFEGYEKMISSIKRTKNEIEKGYKEVEKLVQKMTTKNPNDVSGILNFTLGISDKSATFEVDSEVMNTIDLFIKSKCNQIVEMQSIHSLAFGSKLDATKEAYKQSKDILYKALSKINKRGDE